MKNFVLSIVLASAFLNAATQPADNFVQQHYSKKEARIPMRDGTSLFTVIYIPKDASASNTYPFLMERTPYSSGPYGENKFPRRVGPNAALMQDQYIFVYQDVRGRYMSEGKHLEVTPHIPNKKNNKEVDESSDTWDSIDWLLKNIAFNNGKVGIWGVSYPGFYASASLPGAHPALKAVSPQAPVTDEFIGDDVNHNGAFFLMDNFNFMNYFGKSRTGPVEDYGTGVFQERYPDAYKFFLDLGSLSNTQSKKYFDYKSYVWNEYLQHDTYDDYWKSRNIRQHLKNITIPTLVVGGWFDAEDLFGALHTYQAIEKQSPVNNNMLVMGPWTHGAWGSADWDKFGPLNFGSNTSKFYQDSIETLFFNYYLKEKGSFAPAEATVFETGSNQWKRYPQWPPANSGQLYYYPAPKGKLAATPGTGFDEYVSDPAKPVPYTAGVNARRNNEYMVEDQRFAATRPDVLTFETDTLAKGITLSGPVIADLIVSTSGTDADFVVKIIDVYPNNLPNAGETVMGGYQQLVRAEVFRGKFRNSFEKPQPFVPGKRTSVKIRLNDVAHHFAEGHKIMIQVQSSWFPLVDRNPQQFMKIAQAKDSDFKKASIRMYHASKFSLPVLQE